MTRPEAEPQSEPHRGLRLLIVGYGKMGQLVEAMAVEKAIVKISPTDPQTATREVMPPDWAPWSLLGTGAVVVLYSFSVPQKISGGG